MSSTTVVRTSQSLAAVTAMDTAHDDGEPIGFATPEHAPPERGIEGVNRLMIEAAPALELPSELRGVAVHAPESLWRRMLGGYDYQYPFTEATPPTWDEFMTRVRTTVTLGVNDALQDAAITLDTIQERNMAEAQVLRDANSHLRTTVDAMGERLREVVEEMRRAARVGETINPTSYMLGVPLPIVPRFERTLLAAIAANQYSTRRFEGLGRSGRSRSRPTSQIPTSRDRASRAERARSRRRTLTRENVTTGIFGDSDSDRSDDEFADSETGAEDTFRLPHAGDRLQAPPNLGTADRPVVVMPETPAQPSAASLFTQAVERGRPQTAIPPPVDLRPQRQAPPKPTNPATWVPECGNCHRVGHATIACPRCEICQTYGHDARSCRWCRRCQARHCKERCGECRVRHSHLIDCPLVERQILGMAEGYDAYRNRRTEGRRTRGPEVQLGGQPASGGRIDGEGVAEPARSPIRLGQSPPISTSGQPAPAGGRTTMRGALSGNPPPPPPPGSSEGRRSRSRSPRRRRERRSRGTPGLGGDPDSSDSSPDDDDSSSSSSDSDSDSEDGGRSSNRKIRKLKKKLKALEKKKRPHKPDRLDVRPFDGNPDDLKRFAMDVESKFDYHRKSIRKDMDKIRLIVPLLEGKAKKWYESIHIFINKQAADRERIPFDKNSPYRKWDTFFDLLRSSFGGGLTRDRYVLEWNRLRHKEGHIDEFLDRILNLMYAIGYSGDIVKDKIKEGLTDEMRKNWALVQNKPEPAPQYMASLRAFAHEIEQNSTYSRNKSRGTGDGSEPTPKRRSRKEKRERRETAAPSQAPSGSTKKGTHKDRETELKGIPESIRDERRKVNRCLKCGKPGHTWYNCFSKTPVTHSVAQTSVEEATAPKKKRKRKRNKDNDQNEAKKAKVERATEAKPTGGNRSPSPRIFEIEDSDAMSIV